MAKALISAEKLSLYELISDNKIPVGTGAEALSRMEAALSASGGGGSTDVSALAKETTLTGIDDKLPALSSGNIPVVVAEKTLTPDKRLLTENTTIPAGSIYCYLKVVSGDVTIDGLTYSTGEFINYESCYPCKYPAISIVIPAGKSVRLDRGS